MITESVFSMDGDLAPLPEIAAAAVESGVMLMVDEAHATGVFGPGGSGLIREHGLKGKINVSMGTLSKALGGYGGIYCRFAGFAATAGQQVTSVHLYHPDRPPAVAGSALGAWR